MTKGLIVLDRGITEVAKLLGVSRQTIYNKINNDNLHHFTKQTDKGKVLSEEGFNHLKNIFCPVNDTVHRQPNSVNDSKYIDILIDSLKNENTSLREIVNSQSSQIDELTEVLKRNQDFQKQQLDRIRLLEDEKILLLNPPVEEAPDKVNSFWQKLNPFRQ
jgi:predicted transcriptional regulator YheO